MRKSEPPLFSVIIPVFNRPEFIRKSVNSVLKQTFNDYELIVVDDGSTDDTAAVLEDYSGKCVVLRQKNMGVSSARNLGIRHSCGCYTAFLDSDDVWYNVKLERQAEFILKNPDVRIFQSNENWIRYGKKVNPMRKHMKASGEIFSRSLELCLVSPSAVVVKKNIFDDYGMFDERMKVCEDYDLWLRISSREEIMLQDEYLLDRRGGHQDQLSSSCWGMDRFRVFSMIKLLEENSAKCFLKEQNFSELLNVLGKKLKILEDGAFKRGNSEFAAKISGLVHDISSGMYNSKGCLFLLE